MIIGVPKEIKEGEYRVSVIPDNIKILVENGHTLMVETGAGKGADFSDDEYLSAGASIVNDVSELWEKCRLIVKVKEILPEEFKYLKESHIIMTYIHSANRLAQTEALLKSRVVAIAYEDIMDEKGNFPLLAPMSDIAGSVGLLMGVFHMFNTNGGKGRLVCGAPGVDKARIVIFGAGNAGLAATKLASGLGAHVTLMDKDVDKLRDISIYKFPDVTTLYSSKTNVLKAISDADMVINAVKWFPGLTIISRDMLKYMKKGALIVDIDAEPGGAIETARYSSHSNPMYTIDGVHHICIPNLPGAVANTASVALSNATLPYIAMVAGKGWRQAVLDDKSLMNGLDFVKGKLTFKPTASAFGLPYVSATEVVSKFENNIT